MFSAGPECEAEGKKDRQDLTGFNWGLSIIHQLPIRFQALSKHHVFKGQALVYHVVLEIVLEDRRGHRDDG